MLDARKTARKRAAATGRQGPKDPAPAPQPEDTRPATTYEPDKPTFGTDQSSPPSEGEPSPPDSGCGKGGHGGCDFTFHITAAGDVNIHNHCAPPPAEAPAPEDDEGFCTNQGSCLPAVAGAKHKLGRAQKMAIRAANAKVASVLAASTMHGIRRFVAGATPANALEQDMFATLARMPKSFLKCAGDGLDGLPAAHRATLFSSALPSDVSQPIDATMLAEAVTQEIRAHAAVTLFGDAAVGEERPGLNRLFTFTGEQFPQQVRICRVNQLRTSSFVPTPTDGEFTPQELQQDCGPIIVDGEAEVVCEVRTSDCPGNTIAGVCGRVLDVAPGGSIELEGVNFFNVAAIVRLVDKDTRTITRDVQAFVWGDLDTPREETVDGEPKLINDCRVKDRITFTVPSDVPSGLYEMNVFVPNDTGDPFFGDGLFSNTEYLHILPAANARYQIVVERIIARVETAPASWGSDEVGLRVLSCAMNLAGTPLEVRTTRFPSLDGVEFDSGTRRDVERIVFASDEPIAALVLAVMGHEIDSERAYNREINEWTDFFVDLVERQWNAIRGLVSVEDLKGLGWKEALAIGIAIAVVGAIDLIISLWAPADLIIEDVIALSMLDLDRLTNASAPGPGRSTSRSNGGLTVNVNKTIPPEKLPLQYRETREYVSSEEESRYELTYRYNRIA